MNTSIKPWYKSKGVWVAIITILVGLYESVLSLLVPELNITLPLIPGWVIAVLGALGLYSRTAAVKRIQ